MVIICTLYVCSCNRIRTYMTRLWLQRWRRACGMWHNTFDQWNHHSDKQRILFLQSWVSTIPRFPRLHATEFPGLLLPLSQSSQVYLSSVLPNDERCAGVNEGVIVDRESLVRGGRPAGSWFERWLPLITVSTHLLHNPLHNTQSIRCLKWWSVYYDCYHVGTVRRFIPTYRTPGAELVLTCSLRAEHWKGARCQRDAVEDIGFAWLQVSASAEKNYDGLIVSMHLPQALTFPIKGLGWWLIADGHHKL